MTRAPGHPSKGFTTVELIITMVIIGILAAFAGPAFFDIGAFRERGFYDETVSAVRYAQKLAIATGCNVRVRITTTGSVTVYRAGNAATCTTGPWTTAVPDPSGMAPTLTRTAPDGVTLSAADFYFEPVGRASAGVTITVGGRSFQVIQETGFVRRL